MLASDTNLVLKLTLTRCRKLSSWTSHLLHPFKQRIARGSPCVSHVTGARLLTESQNPFQNIYSYICRCHFSKELDGQCLSNCFEKNARFFFFTLTKRGIYLVCARLRVFAPDVAPCVCQQILNFPTVWPWISKSVRFRTLSSVILKSLIHHTPGPLLARMCQHIPSQFWVSLAKFRISEISVRTVSLQRTCATRKGS